MTKEQEKAIKLLENYKEYAKDNAIFKYSFSDIPVAIETILDLIKQLQAENEKKDKIIDEMAGYLSIVRGCPNEDKGVNLDCENRCSNDDNIYEECWKMYFKKKVEEIN